MNVVEAIARVVGRQDLTRAEMRSVMREIMTGEATDAQIGGLLMGLRMKGETVDEITGAAESMRELSVKVSVPQEFLVDTCGTGGSGSNKFNVSTASAMVAAAAGARVAKHGNRAASSKAGSADLLEAAGVNLDLTPEQVGRCITEVGVGFLFALKHHGAMKHAIGPRRELGTRTIFNLLGPLTNPAGARNQLLGVYSRDWVRPVAEVLSALGSRHVMVVHSQDGLDEISVSAPTHVAELKGGDIMEFDLEPEELGVQRAPLSDLVVGDAAESLALVELALSGENHAATSIVKLNAGAAIYVAGRCDTLKQGIVMADDVISAGLAQEKFKEFSEFTRQLAEL